MVGGTAEAPALWHEVPLDDLSTLLPEYAGGRQIVPLLQSSNREEAECFSAYAAQQGIAQKVGVKQHQYAIAFARSPTSSCRAARCPSSSCPSASARGCPG